MQEYCTAVILAAGNSHRMEGIDKLWYSLGNRVILAYTIDVFDSSSLVDSLVLVIHPNRIDEAKKLCTQEGWKKVIAIVSGGKSRQQSVRLGLEAIARLQPACQWVMVHDGARPIITHALLETGLDAAKRHLAAIPVVAVKDTIKEVEQGLVRVTLDRSRLRAVQTPQIFSFPLLYLAHCSSKMLNQATDDGMIVEAQGHCVATFPGSYENIKITTPEDLLFAEIFLTRRSI